MAINTHLFLCQLAQHIHSMQKKEAWDSLWMSYIYTPNTFPRAVIVAEGNSLVFFKQIPMLCRKNWVCGENRKYSAKTGIVHHGMEPILLKRENSENGQHSGLSIDSYSFQVVICYWRYSFYLLKEASSFEFFQLHSSIDLKYCRMIKGWGTKLSNVNSVCRWQQFMANFIRSYHLCTSLT